ncbi:hypothetical protein [Ectothiorhodospira shaposhnikovii]|uniref:hypothetical protein n=1 Tax=Ectothiorhodospira shaposhnikovii TaxID=1054 RepID=UPI001EE90926|nr:hypothetical protein [Ectothiorhodospira shaposhnikovii]MCG5513523.1 hypothetical protein [Ectothiorhodospira shaposhnikovii]
MPMPLLKALTVLPLLWLLSACNEAPTPPQTVPLMMLVNQPANHDGRLITTEGTVRRVEEPLHYWIEDAQLRRVAIQPDALIAPYLGRAVRVTGRFSHAPDQGRRLQAEHVIPLDD